MRTLGQVLKWNVLGLVTVITLMFAYAALTDKTPPITHESVQEQSNRMFMKEQIMDVLARFRRLVDQELSACEKIQNKEEFRACLCDANRRQQQTLSFIRHNATESIHPDYRTRAMIDKLIVLQRDLQTKLKPICSTSVKSGPRA